MIQSFRHKGLEDFHYDGTKNRWSVRISGNWRVTFSFEQGEVYDVDYEDYH
jgi:proteic killer suppression protein